MPLQYFLSKSFNMTSIWWWFCCLDHLVWSVCPYGLPCFVDASIFFVFHSTCCLVWMHEDRMGFVVNGTTFLIKYFKAAGWSQCCRIVFLYGIHWFKLGDFALRVSSGLEFVVIFRFLYKSLLHFSFLVECILSIEPIFWSFVSSRLAHLHQSTLGGWLVCGGSGKTGKPWISFLWGVLEGGAASMCVSMVMALWDTLTTDRALKLIVWQWFVFSIFCDYGLIVAWFSRVSPRLCCACID